MNSTITIHHLPVHTPFAIATGTMQAADCAVVELDDGCGNIGLGEAAPFSAVTGEDLKKTADAMSDLCETIRPLSPEQAIKALSRKSSDSSIPVTALCAIESAVFDLIARRQSIPLWRLFGSPTLDGGSDIPAAIATDITVTVMPPDQVPGFMDKFSAHGFRTFKVKVSGRVEADTECVRAVVDWGTKHKQPTEIILDGNQGFDLERAGQLLANLAKLNIVPVCFEQPLPRSDIKGLAKLSRMTSVPVLLDESVTTVDEVVRAYHAGAGSMINIKITKSGVVESLRMIMAAKSLGMGLMIGGMLETEIAMGFSLQMAAGLGGFNLIDLDTPFFIEQRLTVNSPWHHPTALLDASRTAGSGLMLLK